MWEEICCTCAVLLNQGEGTHNQKQRSVVLGDQGRSGCCSLLYAILHGAYKAQMCPRLQITLPVSLKREREREHNSRVGSRGAVTLLIKHYWVWAEHHRGFLFYLIRHSDSKLFFEKTLRPENIRSENVRDQRFKISKVNVKFKLVGSSFPVTC